MNIRKYLSAIFAVAVFASLAPGAQAAQATGNFNVTVTLTSVCTMAAIGDLAFGTYTAFQGGALVATPTSATLTCSRGLAGVTANFDTAAPGSTAAAAAANAVGAGVVQGLQYTILATAGAPVAGTAATAGSIGTGDSRPYAITGNMPANQAGNPSQNASPQVRTLMVNY
jgi:hypothetical protein